MHPFSYFISKIAMMYKVNRLYKTRNGNKHAVISYVREEFIEGHKKKFVVCM